jgi:competence protein ComEC
MLGQVEVLPDAVARGLRAAGLAHLVALSGLHVGLLAGLILMVTPGMWPAWRFSLVILMVGGYVCLAGARPSLVRSTLMLIAMVGARLLRRPPQAANALGWVAAGMVLLRPSVTRDLGFQLTVAATAGILVLAPRLQLRWTWIPVPLRQAFSVSLGANLAALPWTLSAFYLATPLSPFWNLAGVPWAAVTLVLVFGWVSSSIIMPPAAPLLEPILEVMGAPLEMLGQLPPEVLFSVPVGLGWWRALLLTIALIACLLTKRKVRIGVALGLVGLSLVWRVETPADPELTVIDVGQGDAILLRDGEQGLLVDGGGWRRSDIAQKILIPALARLGVSRLTAMVLTHPDIDHCEGLLALASYVPIGSFYTTVGWHRDPCVVELLGRAGLEASPLWRGEHLTMASWRIRVLHPGAGARQGRNNRSLVLLAETSNRRVLLTGDLEAPGERELLQACDLSELGEIDVLKIGHHGSKTSTSLDLLSRTHPRLALISCGTSNRYGHPSPEILERLRQEKVQVLRTDLHGAIRVALPADGPMKIYLPGLPRRR